MRQQPVAFKAASFLQARCVTNYLNLKMKTHVLAKAYPLTLRMARSNLVSRSFNVQQPMDLMYIHPLR
jgi:hypothetical protein